MRPPRWNYTTWQNPASRLSVFKIDVGADKDLPASEDSSVASITYHVHPTHFRLVVFYNRIAERISI